MSQMRISSVGCLAARPQVPPDLRRVGDHAGLGQHLQQLLPVVPALEDLRQPRARQVADDDRPERLQPGVVALPERRGGRERQQVRHEVADLAHQVDAQVGVLDAGMDVHAADRHAPRQALVLGAEDAVALHVHRLLLAPVRPGVGRGGDHPHAELARGLGDGAGAARAISAPRLADGGADAGADLDLALQELVGDPAAEALLAAGHELRRLARGERPGLRDRRAGTPPRSRSRISGCRWSSASPAALAGASGRIRVPSSVRLRQARAMLKRFEHVGMTVGDLDRCLAFYCGLLGLRLLRRRPTAAGGEVAFLDAGGGELEIVCPPGGAGGRGRSPPPRRACATSPSASTTWTRISPGSRRRASRWWSPRGRRTSATSSRGWRSWPIPTATWWSWSSRRSRPAGREAAVAAIRCAQVRALFLYWFSACWRKTTALQVS